MSVTTSAQSHRLLFLQALPDLARDLGYAWIKPFFASWDELPDHSDLDFVIRKKELPNWKALLSKLPNIDKVVFRNRFNVTDAEIYFSDRSYLSLDLIHDLSRKQYGFMEGERVLERSEPHPTGLKACTAKDSYTFILLFHGLNHSPVPGKYRDRFSALPKEEQEEILAYWKTAYGISSPNPQELFSATEEWIAGVQEVLKRKPYNSLWNRLRRSWGSLWDGFSQSEPTLTFSGVDGAGKSTVIEEVKTLLVEKYRRQVVVLRHRPSLVPILSSFRYGKKRAEKRASETLPRQGGNQSQMASLFRFAYYYLDYLIGQFYIRFRYNLRGYTVLYDRYYFDFIADPRRTNLVLSPSLTRPLYRFLLKPQLNILLYALPEQILARKQELSKEDIEELTRSYRGVFDHLAKASKKGAYLSLLNTDLSHTLSQIEREYVKQR